MFSYLYLYPIDLFFWRTLIIYRIYLGVDLLIFVLYFIILASWTCDFVLSLIFQKFWPLSLQTYFYFSLFYSPSCIPVFHMLCLLKLLHSPWMVWWPLFIFFSLFFQFGEFLLTNIHPQWYFPLVGSVY